MLKDIIKLDLAPGGDLPVWENLQRGMRIINTLPTSTQVVSKTQRKGKNYRDTKYIRTYDYDEAEKGSKKDIRKPESTYNKLKKNITIYAVFLLLLFGDQNQRYQGVCAIRCIMDYHESNTLPFTKK